MIKTILVTSALPYANGNLHLGHMLEFIQTDIWVMYHKLYGNNCFHVSGSDSHGTPIMLKSISNNISPESVVSSYEIFHRDDLLKFGIVHDNFYTTHSYENENLSKRMFYRLVEGNYIYSKNIKQLYDPVKNFFLPDRYVIGSCPKCFSDNQYGDVCEQCSYRYDAVDLLNPISVLSGVKPIEKSSKHYFFDLFQFNDFLKVWCKNTLSQKEVFNKLADWFQTGLKNWDISRDMPYFGFRIPCEYNKFFYVWLDAPIGYLASFQNFFLQNYLFFNYFFKDPSIELYHFIGKDILYFHTLFWPAILNGLNLKLPNDVFVHGFLTINGKKMSKSNNTFITAKSFCEKIEVDYLRYYFASKLSNSVVDIDFVFDDFMTKVNSDLIGKFLNIFVRSSKIIIKNYNSILSDKITDYSLFYEYLKLENILKSLYDNREYSKVVFYIMKYADRINLYIDNEKPWHLLKDKLTYKRANDVCTTSINLFIILLLGIKPILPKLSTIIENVLHLNDLSWVNFNKPLLGGKIKNYIYIASRVNKSDSYNL